MRLYYSSLNFQFPAIRFPIQPFPTFYPIRRIDRVGKRML